LLFTFNILAIFPKILLAKPAQPYTHTRTNAHTHAQMHTHTYSCYICHSSDYKILENKLQLMVWVSGSYTQAYTDTCTHRHPSIWISIPLHCFQIILHFLYNISFNFSSYSYFCTCLIQCSCIHLLNLYVHVICVGSMFIIPLMYSCWLRYLVEGRARIAVRGLKPLTKLHKVCLKSRWNSILFYSILYWLYSDQYWRSTGILTKLDKL